MRNLSIVSTAVLSLALGACGGGGGTATRVDGGPPDAAGCLLDASYVDLTLASAANRFAFSVTAQPFAVIGTVVDTPPRQGLAIVLGSGAGAFLNGFASGTFNLEDENQNQPCGACLEGWGGYDLTNMQDPTQVYLANAGTLDLTFTAGDPAIMDGVYNGVTLVGYDIDANGQPTANNCTSSVDNLAFFFSVTGL